MSISSLNSGRSTPCSFDSTVNDFQHSDNEWDEIEGVPPLESAPSRSQEETFSTSIVAQAHQLEAGESGFRFAPSSRGSGRSTSASLDSEFDFPVTPHSPLRGRVSIHSTQQEGERADLNTPKDTTYLPSLRLTVDLQALNKSAENLEAEGLKEVIKKKSEDLKVATDDIKRLNQELFECSNLKNEKRGLEQKVENLTRKIATLSAKLTQQEKQTRLKEQDLLQKEASKVSLETTVETLTAQNESLRLEVCNLISQREQLLSKKSSTEVLENQLKALSKRIEVLQNSETDLEEQLTTSKQNHAKALQTIKSIQDQLHEKTKDFDVAIQELVKSQQEVKNLKEKLSSNKDQTGQNTRADLQKQLTRSKQNHAKALETVKVLRNQLTEKTESVNTAVEELVKHREQIKNLKEKLSSHRDQTGQNSEADLEEQLTKSQQDHAKVFETVKDLQKQLTTSKRGHTMALKTIKGLRGQLYEKAKDFDVAIQELVKSQQEVKNLKENSAQSEILDELREQIASQNETIQQQQDRIDRLYALSKEVQREQLHTPSRFVSFGVNTEQRLLQASLQREGLLKEENIKLKEELEELKRPSKIVRAEP